jgi:putative FmdB family regulatory protein
MPTYDYECAACRRRFEVVHGVHAEGPMSCPSCGEGPVRKVITAANVHYKGSGWAKKERRTPVGSGASKGGGDSTGSDDGSKSDATAASEVDGSGKEPKKTESGSTESAAVSGSGASKKTEKPAASGASKTAD